MATVTPNSSTTTASLPPSVTLPMRIASVAFIAVLLPVREAPDLTAGDVQLALLPAVHHARPQQEGREEGAELRADHVFPDLPVPVRQVPGVGEQDRHPQQFNNGDRVALLVRAGSDLEQAPDVLHLGVDLHALLPPLQRRVLDPVHLDLDRVEDLPDLLPVVVPA